MYESILERVKFTYTSTQRSSRKVFVKICFEKKTISCAWQYSDFPVYINPVCTGWSCPCRSHSCFRSGTYLFLLSTLQQENSQEHFSTPSSITSLFASPFSPLDPLAPFPPGIPSLPGKPISPGSPFCPWSPFGPGKPRNKNHFSMKSTTPVLSTN